MSSECYLDWNATAPIHPDIQQRFVENLTRFGANPHSQHRSGRAAMVAVDEARDAIAAMVGCQSKQVRFTSGATEANTWLMHHFTRQPGVILGSAVEHPAVGAWLDEQIPVNPSGSVDLEWLHHRLAQGGVSLLSVMTANNETGVIQPVDQIATLCREHSVLFHTDAAQVYNRIERTLPADFITLSGHKMGAPKGVGALILNQEIAPLMLGGAQERGTRAGTLNAPAIATWGDVVRERRVMSNEQQDRFEEALQSQTSAQVIGRDAPRLPNTTLALFDVPGDMLVMALDMKGIAVSTGSACSSGSSKDSFVLHAMGLSGKPVRFSWGHETSLQDVTPIILETIQEVEQACAW